VSRIAPAILVFALVVAAGPAGPGPGDTGPPPLAFVHATVVDVAEGHSLEDRTVVVHDRRIVEVGPSDEVTPPDGAVIVDATGWWILPGLWDMHAHPDDPEMWHLEFEPEDRDLLIPQFPLWGVTGIRDMGGAWETIEDWRRRIADGSLLGPRIVAAGPLVDGPRPMWPGSIAAGTTGEGRAAVDSVVALGADFVKVYQLLPREAYDGIASRAKEVGIPFAGHVPNALSTVEVSEAGQASIEHVIPLGRESADEGAVRAAVDAVGDAADEFRGAAMMEAVLEHHDPAKALPIYRTLIANGTWVVPTLLVWHQNAYFDPADPSVAERLPYMPRYIRRWWTPEENVHLQDRDEAGERMMRAVYRSASRIVGEMREAGLTRFLVGTDTGGNPHTFPGSGVHDEMALLVEAGLEPAEAIRAATSGPAEFLGLSDSLGTVAAGKLADLVLLEADPLADITNTRRIAGVVVGGRWIDADERARSLEWIRQQARGE